MTEHKWVDLSLEGLKIHNSERREALTTFKDERKSDERKSAADQRWLSAPLVVKLANTSATSSKNSENCQRQVQHCQQVPHWVIQGHDDQAGHHLALPSQNQAEIRVGHHDRSQHPGSSEDYLQVHVIANCEAKDTA